MEWKSYTTKETLEDNDELMILDKDANANKRTLMDKVWDYVVDKMTSAVVAKLTTTDKTMIGAINELNSNTILKSNGLRYYSAHVDSEEKTVRLTFGGHFAGILIVDQNKYTNIYAVGASSGIKQISIGNAGYPQPSKSGNTISIPMCAWSSFILITNDNSVIKL